MERPFECDAEVRYIGIDLELIKDSIVFHA